LSSASVPRANQGEHEADAADLGHAGAVASRLRLTPLQRRFAEALAADPERNQTRAARAAGADKDAAVRGSKLVRLGKVREYLQALSAESDHAERRQTAHAVISAREVLQALSAQARADITDFLRIERGPVCSGCGRGGDSVVLDVAQGLRRGKGHLIHRYTPPRKQGKGESLTLVSSLRALALLGRFYQLERGGGRQILDERETTRQALARLPPEVLRQVHLAFLGVARRDGQDPTAPKSASTPSGSQSLRIEPQHEEPDSAKWRTPWKS
jgi:hypothetical protein